MLLVPTIELDKAHSLLPLQQRISSIKVSAGPIIFSSGHLNIVSGSWKFIYLHKEFRFGDDDRILSDSSSSFCEVHIGPQGAYSVL
jgi:hypothetical protein